MAAEPQTKRQKGERGGQQYVRPAKPQPPPVPCLEPKALLKYALGGVMCEPLTPAALQSSRVAAQVCGCGVSPQGPPTFSAGHNAAACPGNGARAGVGGMATCGE